MNHKHQDVIKNLYAIVHHQRTLSISSSLYFVCAYFLRVTAFSYFRNRAGSRAARTQTGWCVCWGGVR